VFRKRVTEMCPFFICVRCQGVLDDDGHPVDRGKLNPQIGITLCGLSLGKITREILGHTGK